MNIIVRVLTKYYLLGGPPSIGPGSMTVMHLSYPFAKMSL